MFIFLNKNEISNFSPHTSYLWIYFHFSKDTATKLIEWLFGMWMYYLTINLLVIKTNVLSILPQIRKLNLLVYYHSIARILVNQGSFYSNLSTANVGYFVKRNC